MVVGVSVTKCYMGVGGSLKHQKERDILYGRPLIIHDILNDILLNCASTIQFREAAQSRDKNHCTVTQRMANQTIYCSTYQFMHAACV